MSDPKWLKHLPQGEWSVTEAANPPHGDPPHQHAWLVKDGRVIDKFHELRPSHWQPWNAPGGSGGSPF